MSIVEPWSYKVRPELKKSVQNLEKPLEKLCKALLCQVGCEVVKQVSNYSIQYYNGGKYPLPQTMLVTIIEIIKLVATIVRSCCNFPSLDLITLRSSLKFLLPSLLYTVNNNIYFAGLILVPPPIWIILLSFRTFITATLYKVKYYIYKKRHHKDDKDNLESL